MVDAAKVLDKHATEEFINKHWDSWFVPGLSEFITIPNLTPMVDPDYLTNGNVEKVIQLVDDYVNKLDIKGLSRKIYQPAGMPPLVVYIVEGSGSDANLMLYGHLDKQPWMEGWDEGLAATTPVIRDGYLYGRGGADDGYAVFTCMLAIKNAQHQGVKWPRCVMVLETEEESGSGHLIALLDAAKEAIGKPDFLFCMDSGAFDYKSMWLTSSLRGICIIDITVSAAKGGFHSGLVGGVVPETFRVLRELLNRIDDSKTGKVCAELATEIPEWAQKEAKELAQLAGAELYNQFAVEEGV
jgi:acetylornithine deacetylase/succinyl-diaminopimelate desuccinylase-like protein